MSRILFDKTQRLNIVLAEFGKFREHIGQVYRVYKFRKTGTGITRLTTQGEKDFNKYSTNKTSQFLNIYNGKAPITVVWNNSTNLSVSEDGKRIIKKYEVGDYYYMVGNNNFTISMANDNLSLLGKDYVTQYINKTVVLESTDWIPDNDDIVDYIYMILDKRSQCYLWLELTNYEPTYNEETREYQYGIFTFETLNTKYTTTGKTILDFIQFGSMGEGYAFPLEIENEKKEVEVSLEPSRLDEFTKGTKDIQLDFLSAVGLSSIFVLGRKKIENLENIEPTKKLLLYKSNFPVSSPFFYNTQNANTFFTTNAKATKVGIWKSYKENYKGNDRIGEYNILNKKEVMCGFEINSLIDGTNPILDGKYKYNVWDNFPIYHWGGLASFYGILKMLNKISAFYQFPDFKLVPYKTIADFLNINDFFNAPYDVFNFQYEEITRFKLTDTVGILGGIVNAFIGGLDIGWTSSRLTRTSSPMGLIIPCISYLDGKTALNDSAPLPVDVFIQDKEAHILPVSTNIMCSYNFSLTDLYFDGFNIKIGRPQGQGGDGIWDTKYIGQTTYEDGEKINADGSPLKINAQGFHTLPPKNENGFIVDGLGYHAVGITDTRITTYDVDGKSSYEAYFETMSKARGDVRIWKNFIKFNCYENWNTTGKINWPKDVIPPQVNHEIEEQELTEILNKPIFNYEEPTVTWTTPAMFGYTATNRIGTYSTNNEWEWLDFDTAWEVFKTDPKNKFISKLKNTSKTRTSGAIEDPSKPNTWTLSGEYEASRIVPFLDITNINDYAIQKEKIPVTPNLDINIDNSKLVDFNLEWFDRLEFSLSSNPEILHELKIPRGFMEKTEVIVDAPVSQRKIYQNSSLEKFGSKIIKQSLVPNDKLKIILTRTSTSSLSISFGGIENMTRYFHFIEESTMSMRQASFAIGNDDPYSGNFWVTTQPYQTSASWYVNAPINEFGYSPNSETSRVVFTHAVLVPIKTEVSQ